MIDVTVILPVHNAIANYPPNTLGRAVQSIEDSQDVAVQLVVVDDGSDDDTYATAKALLANITTDSKLVKNRKRSGVGYSTAKGAKYAKGRYMMYLPVRAWLAPNALSLMVNALDNVDEQSVLFAYPSIQYVGAWSYKRLAPNFDHVRFTLDFLANFMLWRSNVYEHIQHRDVLTLDDGTMISVHDYDFCLQMMHVLNGSGLAVPEAVVHFEHSHDPKQDSNLALQYRQQVRARLSELHGVSL